MALTARPFDVSPRAACACCGDDRPLLARSVLWPELVCEWGLSADEAAYVDRQQGATCPRCGCNLRSIALARAILDLCGAAGPLAGLPTTHGHLRVLEVNEAGGLTPFLSRLPEHRLGRYPALDMTRMPFPDATFDLVVHSDTLEHVADPIAGLRECRRVLRDGGACAFTVPIVVDRLTRSRDGLPPSYHNAPGERDAGMAVRTEYGADAWKHVVLAGFRECRLAAVEYPAAIALSAIR